MKNYKINFIKITVSITVSMLILLPPSLYSQTMQSSFVNTAIITDGNNVEWGEIPKLYSEETKMLYEARNNNNNLYLIFQIPDQMAQIKIMNVGFEINFSIKTKPKVNATIKFPTVNTQQIKFLTTDNSLLKENRLSYLLASTSAFADGFLNETNSLRRGTLENAFTYNIAWDNQGVMIFELEIPLNTLFDKNLTVEDLVDEKIKITPKILALENPSANRSEGAGMSSSAGKGSRGGGGRGGGSRGGMSRGGSSSTERSNNTSANRPDKEILFKEQSFKYVIRLSKN